MGTSSGAAVATAAASMSLGLRAVPSLIRAVPATAGGYAWTAAFTARLTETGGVAGRVYAVQAVLLETGRGPKGATDRQIALVDAQVTRRGLPAHGSLAVPVTVHYTLPGGEREALVDVSFIVVGEDGYYHHATRRFTVV
jgi:hypothetical protein